MIKGWTGFLTDDKFLICFEMSLDGESLTAEEVEKTLNEIENKYSPVKSSKGKDHFEDHLTVLSKEFDSLGLPTIDLSQPITRIFKQVVGSARSLVHIHRKTVSRMKDVNIENTCKANKSSKLYKTIDEYKLRLSKCEEKNSILKNEVAKLKDNTKDILKREIVLKEELEKNKRFYLSKQNELHHHIKKLTKENQRFREMLGKDINTRKSKDDVALELLNKYKTNEEIYKNTIRKLQENNKDLLNEIIDLKMASSMALCSNKQECST